MSLRDHVTIKLNNLNIGTGKHGKGGREEGIQFFRNLKQFLRGGIFGKGEQENGLCTNV